MMDIEDDFELELAMSMSKGDDFSTKLDDDLDYAFALSLQSEFDDGNQSLHSPKVNLEQLSSGQGKALNISDGDPDYLLALSLQSKFNKESNKNTERSVLSPVPSSHVKNGSEMSLSIVDNEWEVVDPIPNIHSLFLQFNSDYFWGTLSGVEVRWSPRMTLCAGVCCYEGRGGLCSVRLSQPLLKYRPRRDLVETLLHEMIHAYLFVTHNNKDHDAHGPEFLKHMNRINCQTGTKISVYHSFHNEVDIQRKHWWKCNGPCQHRRPFYGLVKRAMNRAPAPRDPWWADHQAKCGGTFFKVKEPDDYGKKAVKRKQDVEKTNTKGLKKGIQNYFSPNTSKKPNTLSSIQADTENTAYQAKHTGVHTLSSDLKAKKEIVPFAGKGFKLETGTTENPRDSTPLKRDLFNMSKHGSPNLKSEKKPKLNQQGAGKPAIGNGQTKPKGGNNSSAHNRNPTKPNKGAATRNRGSTTVVINENSKYKDIPKEAQDDKKETAYFTGAGHVLGGLPSNKGNQNKAKSPVNRQESIETFFKGAMPKDKVPDKKVVVVFSSDSEDESVTNVSNRNITNSDLDLVPCPVCETQIKSEAINRHLDTCLNNS